MPQTTTRLPVPAIPLAEQLADGDRRTTSPALRGLAALEPALPSWWPADRTHPAFCTAEHRDRDLPADRVCFSDEGNTDLVMDGPYGLGGYTVMVHLEQHVDATAPRIWLGLGDSAHGRHLTPGRARQLADSLQSAEARQLATHLTSAADDADGRR